MRGVLRRSKQRERRHRRTFDEAWQLLCGPWQLGTPTTLSRCSFPLKCILEDLLRLRSESESGAIGQLSIKLRGVTLGN